MINERLDVPLLLLLMWASFAAMAQMAVPASGAHLVTAVTPSVWSEGVVIALIGSVSTTVISLATLWVSVIKMNKMDGKVEAIKTQTNHITTELAQRSREAGHAEGVKDQKIAQSEKT